MCCVAGHEGAGQYVVTPRTEAILTVADVGVGMVRSVKRPIARSVGGRIHSLEVGRGKKYGHSLALRRDRAVQVDVPRFLKVVEMSTPAGCHPASTGSCLPVHLRELIAGQAQISWPRHPSILGTN